MLHVFCFFPLNFQISQGSSLSLYFNEGWPTLKSQGWLKGPWPGKGEVSEHCQRGRLSLVLFTVASTSSRHLPLSVSFLLPSWPLSEAEFCSGGERQEDTSLMEKPRNQKGEVRGLNGDFSGRESTLCFYFIMKYRSGFPSSKPGFDRLVLV